MKPYYEEPGITIYHGDCRDILPFLPRVDLVLTDPPYGISFKSNWSNKFKDVEIENDASTELRDFIIDTFQNIPCLIFGSYKAQRPINIKMILIWEKGTTGMGDLSLPWFPNTEEIYVIGGPWKGSRTSSVLRHWIRNDFHPTEKPEKLIKDLLNKCIPGTILDPFMGSGTTLRAAKDLGRKAIGIEIEEKYCEIAVKRLRQEVLAFEL